MREVVKCLNCGVKWVRVTMQYDGETIELTENLMYNCPNCNSNYYMSAVEPLVGKRVKVVCTYCHRIVEVDQDTADKLDETTAFCCEKCAKGETVWNH